MCRVLWWHALVYTPALAITFWAWLTFVAVPLEIYTYEPDPAIVAPSEKFEMISTSRKRKWAARSCEAIVSKVTLEDARLRKFEFSTMKNFNDGSHRKIIFDFRMPSDAEVGKASIWKRIIYRCFGFWNITVSSPHATILVAEK